MPSNRSQEEREAADAKWWELRLGGYTGPIDHNGDKVEDMDSWLDRFLFGK